MSFNWVKKGLIFSPNGEGGWMNSHAQVPTVLVKNDRLRIYFASRPVNNISKPTFIDLDINDPKKILHLNQDPILELGQIGCFDEFGIMPASVIKHENHIYLYYSGLYRGTTVPYYTASGLAVSDDDGTTFRKMFNGPILDRTKLEPFTTAGPWVIKEGNNWHCWYSSGIGWVNHNNHNEPRYIIKYATSENGIDWKQDNITTLAEKLPLEANARSTLIFQNGLHHMWYCYRGSENYRKNTNTSYKIGYATSKNLLNWERKDELVGISISQAQSDWDSEMIAYPCVVRVRNKLLMFYNGNHFGKYGFGYAEAEL